MTEIHNIWVKTLLNIVVRNVFVISLFIIVFINSINSRMHTTYNEDAPQLG